MQYLSNAYICELNKIDKHFGSTKVLDPERDRKTITDKANSFISYFELKAEHQLLWVATCDWNYCASVDEHIILIWDIDTCVPLRIQRLLHFYSSSSVSDASVVISSFRIFAFANFTCDFFMRIVQ
ncbi:unnamed protein product [Rhizophagus irregularis]|nr:unnamed protein product [Rhizophagus irregularis]CAB5365072.1 unnamed protein product [Rhizophagus irregularis]